MKKYKTIDLFAGAGGLSYGFLETGKFDIKVAVEYNKHAQETYKKNHPDVELEADITKITNDKYKAIQKKYGSIDIVIGGPPCQGFSNANRQKNELISGNNQLVNEYLRAVEQLQPKAFVMENVKMITSSTHKFFCSEKIKEAVEKLGVKLQEEKIAIAETTICTEEFIDFLRNKDDFKEYLLVQTDYMKINTLYRNAKTPEQFNKYVEKHTSAIKKLISDWSNFEIKFEIKKQEAIFNDTKQLVDSFLENGTEYEKLAYNLKVIIEYQKAMYKMQEIRDYNITLIDLDTFNNSICISVNTYNIIEYMLAKFKDLGYQVESGVLNAVHYGVPQSRERFIIIGIRNDCMKMDKVELPKQILSSTSEFYTIRDAIEDLEKYKTSVMAESEPIKKNNIKINNLNPLQKYLNRGDTIFNHVTTDTRETALNRFKVLRQGQNFHDLDENLKTTYSDPVRTQNTIYLRLNYQVPSGTVVNVRKSMWVHPEKDRAISIREAARLQSFPDEFEFFGTKDSQYQQIGNAVPPLLGRAIAEKVLELLGDKPNERLCDIIAEK
ncbi:MAG: DNA cytosine methyltransferase [Clostridiaceae bacterium]